MQLNDYYYFVGNLNGCSFGRRMPDCPMTPLEFNSFKDKFEWFKNLSKEKKDLVVGHHKECAEKRNNIEYFNSSNF